MDGGALSPIGGPPPTSGRLVLSSLSAAAGALPQHLSVSQGLPFRPRFVSGLHYAPFSPAWRAPINGPVFQRPARTFHACSYVIERRHITGGASSYASLLAMCGGNSWSPHPPAGEDNSAVDGPFLGSIRTRTGNRRFISSIRRIKRGFVTAGPAHAGGRPAPHAVARARWLDGAGTRWLPSSARHSASLWPTETARPGHMAHHSPPS